MISCRLENRNPTFFLGRIQFCPTWKKCQGKCQNVYCRTQIPTERLRIGTFALFARPSQFPKLDRVSRVNLPFVAHFVSGQSAAAYPVAHRPRLHSPYCGEFVGADGSIKAC